MIFTNSILPAAISFAIAALSGFRLIPLLKRIHFGQTIYEKGPAWHKSKNGTPIMGGFMFMTGTVIAFTVCVGLSRVMYPDTSAISDSKPLMKVIAGLIFALLNSVIGFIDDYIKAVKKQNLGLKAKQKMAMQLVLSSVFLIALHMLGDTSTEIIFPFIGGVDFGFFYYVIMILYLIFLTNAVNLTDGVDGLCGTVTAVFAICWMMIFPDTVCAPAGTIFSAALAGGCMGFLVWNLNPAKVFMGDTGSMFLGGCVCAMGFITHYHLLLALMAIVYVCEALSVVLQVISFKTTGKRIFKMSPIHHHFEMCGFSEYKIVMTFSAVGLVCGVLGVILYYNYLR